MELREELDEIAVVAAEHAADGERVEAILIAEPTPGARLYLCAFVGPAGRTWLALDERCTPVTSRNRVREAVSIAALCEVAEEQAGGGELEELRQTLARLRMTEQPAGIDEAESAALELERALGATPRVASPAYLDEVGAATRRLEQALGGRGDSPFAVAMREAAGAVEELAHDVESNYKFPLS